MSVVVAAPFAACSWRALGTTALVRAPTPALERAVSAARDQIAALDAVASRFDPGSELSRLNGAGGRRMAVSPLLLRALSLAVRAAELTQGAVDPTIGQSLIALGYDRDWDALAHVPAGTALAASNPRAPRRSAAWRSVQLWDDPPSARIPPTIRLDLGATAKSLAADLAARAAADAGAVAAASDAADGVLVSLGGDIAVCGRAPEGGWPIRVADDHRDGDRGPHQDVVLTDGGLATSSLVPRRWYHDGHAIHHIIDPRTGAPVAPHWRTVSVAAADCAQANIAATAALVLGADAPAWLDARRLPARLVTADGAVEVRNGWPE